MNTAKIIGFLALFVVLATPFAIAQEQPVVDDWNEVCVKNGYDFAIARWARGEEGFVKTGEIEGYDTTVGGNREVVEWTADPAVDGVLHREKEWTFYNHEGGTEGRFENEKGPINVVWFCGNENEVPEFGTTAALVAVLGAVAGIVAFRRN